MRSSCHFVVITLCPHLISIILPLMIPFFVPLCLIPQLLSVHQPIFQSSWHRLSLHSSSCSASHATLCEATQPSSIHIVKPLPNPPLDFCSPLHLTLVSRPINTAETSCPLLDMLWPVQPPATN